MHLRAGPVRPPPELCLDVSLQQRRASSAPTELGGPILEPSWRGALCLALYGSLLVSGARRLPQPAAGPANGGGSEVLSVVPPGGSSEAFLFRAVAHRLE
jgi:hypothetical protein